MNRTYDLSLTDWISIGLNRNNLERVIQDIREGREISDLQINNSSNRAYLEKILREEVEKQFSEELQPIAQIIANSLDAKRRNYKDDFKIKIKVKRRDVRIDDTGNGMGLEDILNFLIIPFSSKKNRLEDIGRHGVGFLSTFNYCIKNPNKTSISVNTRNGEEAYLVEFYSTNSEVGGLRMRLTKNFRKSPSGTTVEISKRKFNKESTLEYLRERFKNIPTYKAKINVNGKAINRENNESKWYSREVILDYSGTPLKQLVGLKIGATGKSYEDGRINLTSQGVLVKAVQGHRHLQLGSTISFPPAIQVVEGRDDFKKDNNYQICLNETFKLLEEYIKDEKEKINAQFNKKKGLFSKLGKVIAKQLFSEEYLSEKERKKSEEAFAEKMLVLIPDLMGAFEINNLAKVPNLEGLIKTLVPEKKYVVESHTYAVCAYFFGEEFRKHTISAESSTIGHWKEVLKITKDLISENITVKEKMNIERVHDIALKKEYANVRVLCEFLKNSKYTKVIFGEARDIGKACLFSHGEKLYINLLHPYVKGSFSPAKSYCVLSDYLMQTNLHEFDKTIENQDMGEQEVVDKLFRIMHPDWIGGRVSKTVNL